MFQRECNPRRSHKRCPSHKWGGDRRISGTLRAPVGKPDLRKQWKWKYYKNKLRELQKRYRRQTDEERYDKMMDDIENRRFEPVLSDISSGDEEDSLCYNMPRPLGEKVRSGTYDECSEETDSWCNPLDDDDDDYDDDDNDEVFLPTPRKGDKRMASLFECGAKPYSYIPRKGMFQGSCNRHNNNRHNNRYHGNGSKGVAEKSDRRGSRGDKRDYGSRGNRGYHNSREGEELMRGRKGSDKKMRDRKSVKENRSNNRNNNENKSNNRSNKENRSNNRSNKEEQRNKLMQMSDRSLKRIYQELRKNQKLQKK